jgi:hypothetical protein
VILQFTISWSPRLEWSLAEQWVLKTDLTPAQPTHFSPCSSLSLTLCSKVLNYTGHLVVSKSNSKHVKIDFISVSQSGSVPAAAVAFLGLALCPHVQISLTICQPIYTHNFT